MHSVKHKKKAMDKSTTGNGKQVRYQRDMEKSFAVIYHNLRRIKEDRQSQDRWAKRRSHSEPQLHAHNPALLTKYEPTPMGTESDHGIRQHPNLLIQKIIREK